MEEFFIVVFGKGVFYQYTLKEILANSFNGFINDELAFKGINFYFPIVSEGSKYYLNDRNSDWSFSLNGEKISEKKLINHGDYITIRGNNISFSMLILSYKKCHIGSKVYKLKDKEVIFIGCSEEMNIILDYSFAISKKHASIKIDDSENAYLEDLSGGMGVYVNEEKIDKCKLKNGDNIFIMGTSIVYYGGFLIIPESVKINSLKRIDVLDYMSPVQNDVCETYVRTPRIQKYLEKSIVEIDPPTPPQRRKEMPFILAVGPSLTMALAMVASLGVVFSNSMNGGNKSAMFTGSLMAISMLSGAILWPKLSRSYMEQQEIENEEYRKSRYLEYISKKEEEIEFFYNRNARIWNIYLYPNIENLIEIVNKKDRRLWERSITDDDFLGIRLGTGDKDFEVSIKLKKRGFELEEDPIKEIGYKMAEKYLELKNIPISISLKEYSVIGVVGNYIDTAKVIITNLVSHYAPDELKIVLIYNRSQEYLFNDFKDLPHMWSSDMKIRYVATIESEAYSLLSLIDDLIQEREATLEKESVRKPHFVVLVFDQSMVANVPFKRILVDCNNILGISTVFFGDKYNKIPKECVGIVQINDDVCGLYIKDRNDNKLIKFKPDVLSEDDQKNLIRSLSNIKIKREKSVSDLPNSISFLDLFQVGNVGLLDIESRWNTNNSDRTLAAPIGVVAGNEKFNLDIHEKYHGCHGLVAGTTGSGKSEFLQAYILSMMINYSPKEVSFLLVDFKGGDMARPFIASPHLSATISNLSDNTLYRALVSLEAEVKNRQRIFNESASRLGVDKLDINSYHKYFKENKLSIPLPHLVIVIDEFAQLKTHHPEFMSRLIDVVQVGRSLGIHLILATQKPSGVVDPQIWSNSRFKVCLKVMDKQDSTDMINRPVAAMIKPPGRAYIQVGYDEVFELVQSGYSGADYYPQERYSDEESITVSMVNSTGECIRKAKDINNSNKSEMTQLEAVMKEITKLGSKSKLCARKLWLDPLQEKLRIKDIDDLGELYDKNALDMSDVGKITVGKMDLPHIQKQIPYSIDFVKDGHLAIYGSTGTGKSTFIQSIFFAMSMKYSARKFKSFIIDLNGRSLMSLSKMPHCQRYVTDESENKVIEVFDNIKNIISHRREVFNEKGCTNYESYISSNETDMPIILVAIDNYAAFREKMYRCEEQLVQLIASAGACGVYFIITASSKGAIYYKITDHISNRVVFNMNDTTSYRDIFNIPVPVYPENVKGRSLVVYNKYVVEMQVAVPFDAESESNRNIALKNMYCEMGCSSIDSGDGLLSKVYEHENVYGNGHEKKCIYQKSPMKKITGMTNIIDMGTDIETGEKIGIDVDKKMNFFICNISNDYYSIERIIEAHIENQYKVNIVSSNRNISFKEFYVEDADCFINEISKSVADKNLLIIDGFSDFFDTISDESLQILENMLRKNEFIRTITIDDMSRIREYCDTELYLHLVRCEDGMVIQGGADNELAILLNKDFYSVPEEYRGITLKKGKAIVYSSDTLTYVKLGGVEN